MKGSRAASAPSGPPEGSPEGVNLSLTGLPPPVSWRPNSASAAKPIARSFSAVSGSEPRRKALEATGPGGSRTINNLRRSNSATHVHQPPAGQAWTGPLRPAEDPHFLTLFEGSPGGKKRLTGLSKAPSERGATWNVLCPRQDDHPRAFDPPPDSGSPGTLSAPVGPRRRECTVPLAPNFTANNRWDLRRVPHRDPNC
uniref:centrosomal protein of 131 kDa-like n=1 Tax=Panthera onca TaxID=9690 RepID=UPI0029529CEA|nr:centrosomal protein of 131 kDa-like [Panthera onca]